MVKIRYSDEFICPKCGRHTALVCRADGKHQAHCMICDVYYDVEIAKTTNADRIRGMTDEELAQQFMDSYGYAPWCHMDSESWCENDSCKPCCEKWLKSPVEVEI